jgi:hypothetical protein
MSPFGTGDGSPLLGGLLKGETRCPEASRLGSGAARLLGLFLRTGGLTGIFGFAARLTTGGPAPSNLAGSSTWTSLEGDPGRSIGVRNAEMRLSNAGVAVRDAWRACTAIGLLPFQEFEADVCNGLAPFVPGRRSTDIVLWGERGEWTISVGASGRVGEVTIIETGLALSGPSC